jgi:hypothetical protein
MLVLAAVTLGLLALLPPVAADEGGLTGFAAIQTHAQGQAATGYFYAVGDEENRLVGALSEINNPPAGSQNIAAFIQRGVAATFVYGMAGGGGPGQAGILPQPPPGEAGAFYPAEPHEGAYQGPVTAGANGPVVDGRFVAKATETPTGRADAAVNSLEVPGQLKIDHAVVTSHTEPADGGIGAESISVLYGVTLGPLHIETIVSRAYGFVSAAPGPPKGIATTVVDGATVNDTAVKVTDKGVVVGDQANPGAQDQVNAALNQAGYSDVRLVPSVATPGENNESVHAVTGTLRVVHRDPSVGASNPQGFSGGGFSVGGAEVQVLGRRCAPDCAAASSGDLLSGPGGALSEPPTVTEPAPSGPSGSAAGSSFEASAPPASGLTLPDGRASSSSSLADSGFGSSGAGASAGSGYLPSGSSDSSSATVAVTPPGLAASAGAASGSPGATALALSAASELNPKVASGLRDGVLVAAAALFGGLLLGARLVVGGGSKTGSW